MGIFILLIIYKHIKVEVIVIELKVFQVSSSTMFFVVLSFIYYYSYHLLIESSWRLVGIAGLMAGSAWKSRWWDQLGRV